MEHQPVLLHEVLDLLQLRAGGVFIDCTLGHAGHAGAIAEKLGEAGLLIGLDVDPRNLEYAAEKLKKIPCRTRLFHANFAELKAVMSEVGIQSADGILADLGVSTNQLFDPHYGLSFERSSPLDMRLDPRLERSAADLVNRLPERELADLLFHLAQERHSRRIARKIVEARRIQPILTTEHLAELVRNSVPMSGRQLIDPATRTFLALRMAVNREVENLSALLELGPAFLAPGGRMAVISFQSTEDRAVKQAFVRMRQDGRAELLTKKPVQPSDAEIAENPRSRSAKMRVMEKKLLVATAL
jgi:16S rRNA (cytosine1402-N4)-methyltransferase